MGKMGRRLTLIFARFFTTKNSKEKRNRRLTQKKQDSKFTTKNTKIQEKGRIGSQTRMREKESKDI